MGELVSPCTEPTAHLPLHPISLGCFSASALSARLHALNLDWSSISHMVIYMFQCYLSNAPTLTISCTVLWTSIHSSSGTPSDLIPWIYLSLLLYNYNGFDLGHTWMVYWFSLLLQFKSEFGNKDFIIWATVSSQSCFSWLYRTYPSLAAKNIINLISSLRAQLVRNLPPVQETPIRFLGREDLLEKG